MTVPEITATPAAWHRAEAGESVGGFRLEKALALIGLLFIFGALRAVLLSSQDSDRTDGSALFQLVALTIFLSAIALLIARGVPSWAFGVLRQSWPLIVLTLLPLVSTLWSQAPGTTVRRAIALILSSTFAFFLVVKFNPRTIFNLLVVAFAIYLALSLLAAAIPGVGITGSGAYAGAWRGFAGEKNVFGRGVALAVALLPTAAVLGLTDRPRFVLLYVTPLGLALLLLSHSATSLVAAFAGIGLAGVLYVALGGRVGRMRLRPEIGITFLLVAAISVALVVTFGWTAILEALGRDPTLTGRTKLWRWAMAVNASREWLGSGYKAFWIDANTKYFFESFAWNQGPDGRSDSFSGPDHAHSGYVDIYLELGLVGITALAATILSAFIRLWQTLSRDSLKVGFIFAVILSFLLVYAVTAKSILRQSEDLWFLFTLLYLLMIKDSFYLRRKTWTEGPPEVDRQ
jgi:O-antigen ligase